MNLKQVVRAPKTDINIQDWRSGHIPRASFPLSHVREKHYKLGPEYRWRIVTFDCLRNSFRLLIVFNEGKQIYRATLGMEVQRDIAVLCQYEFYASEPGWHCHVTFQETDALPIGVGRTPEERYRLEDDGQTIGFLETSGVDFDTDSRFSALAEILREYDANYDEQDILIHTPNMHAEDIPSACVRFSALMLRLQDLLLLSPGRVRRTFREDLIELVKQQFGESAVHLSAPIAPTMRDYIIDIVVRAEDGRALAIYAATSESKALEALLFTRECKDHAITNVKAMLVLESSKPRDIRNRTLSRVMNSDILLASMEGEEIAIKRKMAESLTFH